ncbi:MAG TPA: hypothetical protein VL916_01965, partial [Ilumatobacteraceae bacterium]|nr:hypothetical protein [Ilumatobacteraceae bacterium]
MRLDSLTPSIDVQPGIETSAIVRVSNDRPGPARYSIRVHGLGGEIRSVDVPGAPVAPGHACELEIRLAVPDTIGSGSHTVAIEIHSDRPEESAGFVDVTLTIGSLEQVVVRVDPDIIRGGRRTRFDIEIINRRVEPAEIELSGSGPLLAVDVGVPQLVVEPGEQVRVPAWVHGPEHRSGDPLHHVLTITARGGSTPTYATAAFHQRAAFPGGLRRAIAIFAIISLWLGVAMGLAWWWIGHDDGGRFADNPPASTVTEGSSPDGQPEDDGSSDGGDGSGTDGSGNDGSTDGSGSGSDAEGAGANEGAEAVPTDGQIKG